MTRKEFSPKQIVFDIKDRLYGMITEVFDEDTVEVIFIDGSKIFSNAQEQLEIKKLKKNLTDDMDFNS